MAEPTLSDQVTTIRTLFEERMRIKGATLERQIYKAGRTLPKSVRKAAKNVAAVQAMAEHPKLSKQVDQAALRKDAALVIAHLQKKDARDERIGRILVFLAKISTVLILGFVLTIWYLWSRGLV